MVLPRQPQRRPRPQGCRAETCTTSPASTIPRRNRSRPPRRWATRHGAPRSRIAGFSAQGRPARRWQTAAHIRAGLTFVYPHLSHQKRRRGSERTTWRPAGAGQRSRQARAVSVVATPALPAAPRPHATPAMGLAVAARAGLERDVDRVPAIGTRILATGPAEAASPDPGAVIGPRRSGANGTANTRAEGDSRPRRCGRGRAGGGYGCSIAAVPRVPTRRLLCAMFGRSIAALPARSSSP